MVKLKNKKFLLALLLALLMVSAVSGYLFMKNLADNNGDKTTLIDASGNPTGIDLDPPTEEEQKQVDKTKVDRLENSSNTSVSESVSITELYQDPETKLVVVKTRLYGVNWTKCKVEAKQGSLVLSKSSDVLYQPEYMSCKGFAIDANEFYNSGQWDITLYSTKSDGTIKSSSTKQFTVNK